ncbi:MAG TPA: DUF541 domain-containing protein [Candidatus Wirthbacteria bacterium]|nr:DUF541 domain-containing protein [Candidatus Wirthbacteria bacterium]
MVQTKVKQTNMPIIIICAITAAVLITAILTAILLPPKELKVSLAGYGSTESGIPASHGLSVNASGSYYTNPDLAKIQIGVETKNPDLRKAQTESNQIMESIMQTLKDAGIEEKNMQTANYSISPHTPYDSSEIDYYRVNNKLHLRIYELAKIEEILNRAVEAGANQIGSIEFTLEDYEQAREQSYELAMNAAQKRAAFLANGMDVELGDLLAITGSHTNYRPFYFSGYANQALASEPGMESGYSESISAGQIEVNTQIDLLYAIVNKL